MRDLPDGYELAEGRLVPLHTGARSSWVAGRLLSMLLRFCEKGELGWCFPPGTVYRCFSSRETARRPDATFVRRGRLLIEEIPEEDMTIRPDLAIEVIAPGDLAEEVDLKVADYLGVGVTLVWVVYPTTRSAMVFRKDGSGAHLSDDQELDGEDVVPGFCCPLRLLWPADGMPADEPCVVI